MRRHGVFPIHWIICLALLAPAVVAGPVSPERRADLALFSLLTGDTDRALYWTSGADSTELSLLRGRVYGAMGLPQKAAVQLAPLLETSDDATEARLALAQALISSGETRQVDTLLEAVRRNSNDEAGQEAAFLLSEQARNRENYKRAGDILADMPDGKWAAMGHLNLATDYVRIDPDPARGLISLRSADAMVNNSDLSAEKELRQRILVTAGYLALKNESPEKALTFLDKVMLDGFHTPQALYLNGLAHARQDNYPAAMQAWHRARKYPLAFPGSAKAWLGLARGHDEAGDVEAAGKVYRDAISAFESELGRLSELIEQVNFQGGYQAMVNSPRGEDIDWFPSENNMLIPPRVAYLIQFMQQPQAQQAVRRVAGLDKTARGLEARGRDLVLLASLLERRLQSVQDQRAGERQALERLSTQLQRVRAAQDQVDRKLLVTERLRQRSERALDERLIVYLRTRFEQIEARLDGSDQQLAHLYEYLLLERAKQGREAVQ